MVPNCTNYPMCVLCWLLVTPWTMACQAPLSMGFSRQEYWSGLPCPAPGDLPNPGIRPIVSYTSCNGRQVLYHWHHLFYSIHSNHIEIFTIPQSEALSYVPSLTHASLTTLNFSLFLSHKLYHTSLPWHMPLLLLCFSPDRPPSSFQSHSTGKPSLTHPRGMQKWINNHMRVLQFTDMNSAKDCTVPQGIK